MEEFNKIEDLWKHTENKAPTKHHNLKAIKTNRMNLRNTNLFGALSLISTGIIMQLLKTQLDANIKSMPFHISLFLLSLICFLQAGIMLFLAKKINDIDETQKPIFHLQQWQNFRSSQMKLRKWNMPVYFILLSSTLGIYMYELLKTVDLWKMILAFAVTYAWLLFAYFYLGKKRIKKDDERLDGIISELKQLEQQFH